jgi:molecular chaperone DnaJ
MSPCSYCHGEGREQVKETIEIEIPAGIQEDMQFVIKGKGNVSKYGGVPGDLYVQVSQIENDKFFRKGSDIYTKVCISFVDAALGTKKIVDTVYKNQLRVDIKHGTQSGTYLKLSNKGLKNINGYGYGDMYVYLQVYTPTILNDKEKSLLKELSMCSNFSEVKQNTDKNFFSKIKDFFS